MCGYYHGMSLPPQDVGSSAWQYPCIPSDDVAGIHEGLNAGMWTVGVRKTGNELGLDFHEVAALPKAELASRLAAATARFEAVGTHFVIDGVNDLPPVLDEIGRRMAAGQTPFSA